MYYCKINKNYKICDRIIISVIVIHFKIKLKDTKYRIEFDFVERTILW